VVRRVSRRAPSSGETFLLTRIAKMLGHLLAVAHLVQAVVLTDHPAALNHQEIIVKCLRPPNDVRRLSRFLWTHLWRVSR
jgi:hypothetical protein